MTTTWNAQNYDASHAYVWTLAADLLDLLNPQPGLKNWIEQYCTTFLNAIPPEKREQFLTTAEETARPALFKDNQWTADYRRLRIVAIRRA